MARKREQRKSDGLNALLISCIRTMRRGHTDDFDKIGELEVSERVV